MLKSIFNLIFTISIVYAQPIKLIGTINDCHTFPQISCTVLYLPTQYFVAKSKCIKKILNKESGLYIHYQDIIINVSYLIKNQKITYIYPINNQLINPINYNYNDTYISFYKSNSSNYILYGYINHTIVDIVYTNIIDDDINDDDMIDQLFSYYKLFNHLIFNEFNVFPDKNNIININYKNSKSCKKNNLLIYDSTIYDDTCHIIY